MRRLIDDKPFAASLIAGFFAFLVLGALMVRDINPYDEGIVLTGALRTLAGDIPHRDYYSTYGPGQNYLVAGLFALFGKQLIVARLFSLLLMALTAGAAFVVTLGRMRWYFSLLVLALVLAFLVGWQAHLYPIYPVILLALVGAIALLRNPVAPSRTALILAGACAGGAALFRYDGGFFILVAHCLALAIISWRCASGAWFRRWFVDCIVYALASAAIFLPFAVSYLAVAPLDAFLHDIIRFPTTYYAEMRGLPFPGPGELKSQPQEIAVYFPILILLLAAWILPIRRSQNEGIAADRSWFPLAVMMAVLQVVLFYKGVVRVSGLHMMMSIVPATVLAGLVADQMMTRRGWRAALAITVLIGLAPGLGAIRELALDLRQPQRSLLGWAVTAKPQPRSCAAIDERSMFRLGGDYRAVASFVRRHTPPDARILVGLGRHDKIFVNPQVLYFASDRLPGTRWHHFDPGLQTRGDVQRQMIGELQHNGVQWIVRDGSFDNVSEPNGSAVGSGVHLLDQYIVSRYRPLSYYGRLEIWLSKSVAWPRDMKASRCMAIP
ncbi:hypothetical protein C7451_10569 [Blastomonas natatoria]|uniref:Glycosyltransferase RgtA/B/C/D-like domain-containing protein n=1 Tax=Blastomonas natatoria TaxID=34015 RepID=A0A2V3V6E6_9SPHN|nr:hypothetical protein [Blastomonas natatoria]PXW76298.1 hypothetical protein C7451_10569 [Blastomonas natatoria]